MSQKTKNLVSSPHPLGPSCVLVGCTASLWRPVKTYVVKAHFRAAWGSG